MKFLVDENIGQSVVDYLTGQGYDVLPVRGEFPGREDHFLLEKAFQEGRVILTNDKDFGLLIFRHKSPSHGVILFRFILESPVLKIEALKKLLKLGEGQILKRFIVISEDKIRIRTI